MPIWRTDVSANATPIVFVFKVDPGPRAGEVPILTAITMGAESKSELTKSRSSTAWRFPGEACPDSGQQLLLQFGSWTLASLSKTNFVFFFPEPASGTQISTLSCFAVRASRKKAFATFVLRDTLGRPPFPALPRCLMTEFVWKTCVAMYCASAPWTVHAKTWADSNSKL